MLGLGALDVHTSSKIYQQLRAQGINLKLQAITFQSRNVALSSQSRITLGNNFPKTNNCNRRILQKLTICIYVGAKQEDLGPKIIKCNVLLNREDKVDEIFLSKSNNKRRIVFQVHRSPE